MKMDYKRKIAMALSVILTAQSIDSTTILSEEAGKIFAQKENTATIVTKDPTLTTDVKKSEAPVTSATTTKKAETTTVAATTTKKAETTTVAETTTKKAETTTVAATTTKKAETTTVAATTTKKAETTTVAETTTKKAETTTVAATTTKKAETTTVAATTTKKAETTTVAATTTKEAETTTTAVTTTAKAETTTTVATETTTDSQAKEKEKAVMDKLGSSVDAIPAEDALNHYKDDVIDIKDAQILRSEDKEITETEITSTADIYIESVECIGGDSVAVNVGIVDWTQDIESMEINFEFDSALTLTEVDSYGNMKSVIDGNKIKVYGFYDLKAAYRGRIATFIFDVPVVDELTGYKVSSVGASLYSSKLEKYVANLTDGVITADSSLAPTNVTSDVVNSASVHLTWNPCKDQDKYTGYIVYRNGEEIGRTQEASYSDSGLKTDTEYTYTVQSYDDDGRTSPVSREYKVTPKKVMANGLSVKKQHGAVGGKQAEMAFSLSSSASIDSYQVYAISVGGEEFLISEGGSGFMSAAELVWDLTGFESGEYDIKVVVSDADKTTTEAVLEKVTVDKDAPEPVESLVAFEADECVSLTWTKSSQFNAEGYRIYRRTGDSEYECIGEVKGRDTLAYTDKTAVVGTDYFYNVTVYDCFGQEGEMTTEVASSSRADQTAPQITLFVPKSGSVITGEISVTAKATDNIGVEKIVFFISEDDGETWKETYKGEGAECVWKFDTTVYEECDVKIKAIAYDKNGNESNGTNINSYHIDNKAPQTVTGVETVQIYDNIATIKWNDVSDDDRKNYIVEYTAGEDTKKITVNTIGANLSDLVPDTEYTVVVYAVDINGNTSKGSEPMKFTTLSDMHAPEIVSVSPSSGYYSDVLNIEITARDNKCVKSVDLEISLDGKTFKLLKSFENPDQTQQYRAKYELDLSEYKDGPIYIRGMVTDADGNKSSEGTIVNEYIVDHVKPEKMQGVSIDTSSNSIEIKWKNYENDSIKYFRIYRTDSEDKEYELVVDNHRNTNYFDRSAQLGTVYYYKVSAVDYAGHESELSDAVSGKLEEDTAAPVIESISPGQEIKLNRKNNIIGVLASDNVSLDSITVEYYAGEKESEYKLLKTEKFEDYYGLLKVAVPEEAFVKGETGKIHLRVSAVDRSGNNSGYVYAVYDVDDTSTEIKNVEVVNENNNVTIKWDVDETEQTLGYQIYRKFNDEEYKLIGSIPKNPDVNGGYTFQDINIQDEGICTYQVSAVNTSYNQTYITAESIEILQSPELTVACEEVIEKGVEEVYIVSAQNGIYDIVEIEINYGDGTVEKITEPDGKFIHAFKETGTYEVVVTAKNSVGLTSTSTTKVQVTERSMMGVVDVTVKTTEGLPAAGIFVYCDIGTENQRKLKTDSNGKVSFVSVSGNHKIGVYGDGYLPDMKDCIVTAGSSNPVEFSVVQEDIITAEFDVQRMTLDEIKAAGIDVTAPENQHIVKVNVRLWYEDGSGEKTGHSMSFCAGGGGYGYGIPAFVWDININDNSNGSSSKKREIKPTSVIMNSDGEVETIIFMDIPAEASFLKEFFDVKLHIVNNASSEYTVTDNVVKLEVPDGMTLMDVDGYNEETSYIKEIKGQTQETLKWIIRGDEKGEYKLKADYTGTLSQFNEVVNATFESDAIKVYGEQAIRFDMYVPEVTDYNDMYVKLSVRNVSDIDVYNVSALVDKVMSYTYGVVDEVQTVSYLYEITDQFGVKTYITPQDAERNIFETLSPKCTYSVIYHFVGVFTDTQHPITEEWQNFNERVMPLLRAEIGGDTDVFRLIVCDEKEIRNAYDHSNDEENYSKLTSENVAEVMLVQNANSGSVTVAAEALRWLEPITTEYEENDDVIDFLLNFESDDIKQVDKRDYIKEMILSLVVSDESQQSIEEQFRTELTDAFMEILEKSFEKIENGNDKFKFFKEDFMDLVNDSSAVSINILSKLKTGGPQAASNYITSNLSSRIRNSDTYTDALTEALDDSSDNIIDKYIGEISSGIGLAQDIYDEWGDVLTLWLLRIEKEKALELLDTLSVPADTDGLSIMMALEAANMRDDINDNFFETLSESIGSVAFAQLEDYALELCSNFAEGVIKNATTMVGWAVYKALGFAYGTIQEEIDNKYFLPAKVVILDNMSNCVIRDYESKVANGDVSGAMRYVEYMAKLRIDECTACKSWIYSFENGNFDPEYITSPGLREIYGAFSSIVLPEQLTEDIESMQLAVDKLFMPKIEIVEPFESITYNYALNGTTEEYGSEYEYRIYSAPSEVGGGESGYTEWMQCDGRITVELSDKNQVLQVRLKDTPKFIRSVRLKRKDYLEGDLKVRYVGDSYIFDSICKGKNIQVLFTDKETLTEKDWSAAVSYSGNKISAKSASKYVYVRSGATADEPASQAKRTNVITTAKLLIGQNEGGTVSGAGDYAFGKIATIKATPDADHVFAGWVINGVVVSTEAQYTIEMNSDVTIYARFMSESKFKVTPSSDIEQVNTSVIAINGVYVITSDTDDDSIVFSHWEDENGEMVSLMKIYAFVADRDISLKAVYIPKTEESKANEEEKDGGEK